MWAHYHPEYADGSRLMLNYSSRNNAAISFKREIEESCETASVPRRAGGPRIHETKESLIEAFASLSELVTLREESRRASATGDDRSRALQDSIETRERVTRAIDELERRLPEVSKLLASREKKRARQARKRTRRLEEKSRGEERRARREDEVNARMREKRECLERVRQAENLRKDADVVLADVRGKRTDARKYLGLLQELRNLRRVKVNVARARGENLPLAADLAFDNIIDQLVEEWSNLDREYTIEEQGLKLMLKADNDEKIEKRKRNTFDDWELALFGRQLTVGVELENFLWIRHAWDRYANLRGDGTRVPIGWIIPVSPSSAAWQKCLRRATT